MSLWLIPTMFVFSLHADAHFCVYAQRQQCFPRWHYHDNGCSCRPPMAVWMAYRRGACEREQEPASTKESSILLKRLITSGWLNSTVGCERERKRERGWERLQHAPCNWNLIHFHEAIQLTHGESVLFSALTDLQPLVHCKPWQLCQQTATYWDAVSILS